MRNESGISTYFRDDKIRIRYRTIEELSYPEYIHLKINEDKKHLFIEKCDRDMDAFRIRYVQSHDGKKVREPACYIHARNFLEYMADVIGVPSDSPSLRFYGRLLSDGTVFVDINYYEVIEPRITKRIKYTKNEKGVPQDEPTDTEPQPRPAQDRSY